MSRRQRIFAGLISALVVPGLLATPLPEVRYEDTLTRYARGEASLGELQEARKAFAEATSGQARASALPPTPVPAGISAPIPVPRAPEAAAAGEDEPGVVARIASWIRDIPRRTVRRWKVEDEGLQTLEEAEDLVESSPVPAYTANAAQREADSDWKRPVTVTAKAEVNRVQSVIERVVGFGGLAAIAKALSGDKSAQLAVNNAAGAVKRMTPGQRQQLTQTLQRAGLGQKLTKLIGGKPTTAFGRLVKDKFGNNMLLAVAASTLAATFLNDGLDLDTLKDNLVALNAIESRRTMRENLIGIPFETIAYYHMDRAATRVFDKLWTSVSSGSGGFAGWLMRTENVVNRFGDKIVRHPPAHLAAKAAEFGRSASSLGLPGVSSATALTLRGLTEGMFKAGTVGLIGIPLINAGWRMALGHAEGMYIGGNRSRVFARYDLHDTYFQRGHGKLRDGIEERRWATQNMIDGHAKFPATNFLNYFLRMAGGYIGAVVASSLVAPTTIATFGIALVVSAIFSEGGIALGKWLGAKIDTSPAFFRRLRKKNVRRIHQDLLRMDLDLPERREARSALVRLDRARARMGLRSHEQFVAAQNASTPEARELVQLAQHYHAKKAAYHDRLFRIADQRADDYERLTRLSQVNKRIFFVESFSDVRIFEKDDGYTYIQVGDEVVKAMPRFDFITADGHRGVWDYKTNRVLDVGLVREQNGNRIVFVDDEGVTVEDGVIKAPSGPEEGLEPGTLAIAKGGIVLEKGPEKEWLFRGYGGEYDIVLRGSGRRFVWDGKVFAQVSDEDHAELASKMDEMKDDKTRRYVEELRGKILPDSVGIERGEELEGAFRDLVAARRSRASAR